MDFGIKVLQSQSEFLSVYPGKFLQSVEVIIGIKEKSLQVFTINEEKPEKLIPIHEQLFNENIFSSCKISTRDKDLVCVATKTALKIYEFSEGTGYFEVIYSYELRISNENESQQFCVGIKASIDGMIAASLVQDYMWVLKWNDIEKKLTFLYEIDVESFIVDFNFVDEKTMLILCRNPTGEYPLYFWKEYKVNKSLLSLSTFIHFSPILENGDAFPTAFICFDKKIYIFYENIIHALKYNQKNIDQDDFDEIEFSGIYCSHIIHNNELYINNDIGQIYLLSRKRSNIIKEIPQDSIITTLKGFCYIFGKQGEIRGFNLNTNGDLKIPSSVHGAILDAITIKKHEKENEINSESIIIACGIGQSSSLLELSNSLTFSVVIQIPDIGQSCLWAKTVENIIFLFYTKGVKALDYNTMKPIQSSALGLVDENYIDIGKSNRDWIHITSTYIKNGSSQKDFNSTIIGACISDSSICVSFSSQELVMLNPALEVLWKLPNYDVSMINIYNESIYIGLQSCETLQLDMTGNVINKFVYALQESSIPHSVIFMWNQMFIGCRDGNLIVCLDPPIYKKLGNKPVTLFKYKIGLIAISDRAILIYNENLEFRPIEIDMRSGCSLDNSYFICINKDILIAALENPTPYSLNTKELISIKGSIKRLLYLPNRNKIAYIYRDIADHIALSDYNFSGNFPSLSYTNSEKMYCMANIPQYDGIAIGGETLERKGIVTIISQEGFTELYRGFFPHGVQAICIHEDKMIVGAEEHIFVLRLGEGINIESIATTRVRNSVIGLYSEQNILYSIDSRDGILQYTLTDTLTFEHASLRGFLISNILIMDQFIIMIDKLGSIKILEKDSKKIITLDDLHDGGRAIISGNLTNTSLKPSCNQNALFFSWTGAVYQITYPLKKELLSLQSSIQRLLHLQTPRNSTQIIDIDILMNFHRLTPHQKAELSQAYPSVESDIDSLYKFEII
ncbi:unnamed protein product [Blepharisma stoltei]|uniref:DNA damage-binding protein 1 n=1 Tax=Blepharisma stoltei TaxID=1481888 RepID=A0AAU9KA47_9CILI|nr:unnamed protein product [Blepharisma stoltei]